MSEKHTLDLMQTTLTASRCLKSKVLNWLIYDKKSQNLRLESSAARKLGQTLSKKTSSIVNKHLLIEIRLRNSVKHTTSFLPSQNNVLSTLTWLFLKTLRSSVITIRSKLLTFYLSKSSNCIKKGKHFSQSAIRCRCKIQIFKD